MVYTAIMAILLIMVTMFPLNKMPVKLFLLSPPVLVNIFILAYTVIGFYLFWGGDYYFFGINFDSTLDKSYIAICLFSFVFTSFFAIFFKTKKVKLDCNSALYYKQNSKFLLIYTLSLFAYIILRINGIDIPVIGNLFVLLFNSLVVVLGYSLLNRARWSLVLSIIFVGIIVYIGFRYRLILLFLPMMFYVSMTRRLSGLGFLKQSGLVLAGLLIVSVVGVARNYSSGLSIENIGGLSVSEIIIRGLFNDTSTVMVSGALIDYIGESGKFAYFNQVKYIATYFIPSSIYEGKEYSPIFEYLSILTNQNNNESGLAVLAFAEYYHTAGYFGVAGFAVLFAYIFAISYKKAIAYGSAYNFYFYFALMAWLINSFTRGYLPQNIQDVVSILVGLYIVKIKFSKFDAASVYGNIRPKSEKL